jgi:hypothetical protein
LFLCRGHTRVPGPYGEFDENCALEALVGVELCRGACVRQQFLHVRFGWEWKRERGRQQ